MLMLFAGEEYYPLGGMSDFVKVIGTLDELEIQEKQTTAEIPEYQGRRIILSSEISVEGAHPAGTKIVASRHINLRIPEYGGGFTDREYDWWHVFDTETLRVVATSDVEESRVE